MDSADCTNHRQTSKESGLSLCICHKSRKFSLNSLCLRVHSWNSWQSNINTPHRVCPSQPTQSFLPLYPDWARKRRRYGNHIPPSTGAPLERLPETGVPSQLFMARPRGRALDPRPSHSEPGLPAPPVTWPLRCECPIARGAFWRVRNCNGLRSAGRQACQCRRTACATPCMFLGSDFGSPSLHQTAPKNLNHHLLILQRQRLNDINGPLEG